MGPVRFTLTFPVNIIANFEAFGDILTCHELDVILNQIYVICHLTT